MPRFDKTRAERLELWQNLTGLLEDYYANVANTPVTPELKPEDIARLAGKYSFDSPVSAKEAIEHVISGIQKYGVQVSHPSYYGLYNPRPNIASIMADLITATMNPQIAAWSHAPFAAEIEIFLIQKFGEKFGYPLKSIDGVFCNGGAEANHTAVLCAINQALPSYSKEGLKAAKKDLVLYCSAEAHHSIGKAAMMTGLGRDAVISIPADSSQRMKTELLDKQIQSDINAGKQPCMVVATSGTTGSGAIDPLNDIAEIAHKHKLWLHVDAAYGGAAILDPKSAHVLSGIEKSNSISFDMHKWMSVPMGTSIFLTMDKEILFKTFRITTEYMPHDADELDVVDPYIHSMQWSRRFIGLRTYLSLLIFGWEGYAETVHHQVEIGNYLRRELLKNNWEITNDSELPVICFTAPEYKHTKNFATDICNKVLKSGKAWLSVYRVNGSNSLRACITNYATTETEIDAFVSLLNKFRIEYS